MTRVDFYILPDAGGRSRDLLACKLAEKAFSEGHRVYLNADSPAHARELDELLWTFRDRSFLPHALEQDAGDEQPPIVIGCNGNPETGHDVLINLAAAVPECFSRFARLLEIVNGEASVRDQGRARYKFYRDRGYPLESHQL